MNKGHQEQNPRQGLPDGGSALPSTGTKREGGPEQSGLPNDSMPTKRTGQSRSSGPVAEAKTPQAILQSIRDKITDRVSDSIVRTDEVIMLMRSDPQVIELKLRDSDLEKLIIEAKNCRDGKVEIVRQGNRLNTSPIPWLWEGFIRKGKSNLLYGDPKTGKTRLVLGMLGHYLNNAGSFLGHSLSNTSNEVLIVGPDMCQDDWAANFVDFHIGNADGSFHERIRGVISQGNGFRLDEKGIQLIVEECRESPGLIVMLDSLFTLMSSSGMDENKPGFADPLAALVDAVAPFGATLIVIHHAKKSGVDGSMSSAARGSSAITGFVDQLIHLRDFGEGNAVKTGSDVEVKTQGRRGRPSHLIISFDSETQCWISRGKPSDVQREAEAAAIGEGLPEMQERVVRALLEAEKAGKQGLSQREILDALGMDPKADRSKITNYLKPLLEKKRFVEVVRSPGGDRFKQNKQYRTTKSAKIWASLSN